MILLIAGSSHTGKTLAAQHLLEQYSYPYLSIDHLKMGLIRSGVCPLSPDSPDTELTPYLWDVVKEMIKTAIENHQNLIVEGCYIPFDWKQDFDSCYLEQLRYVCLIFSETYILEHFGDIVNYANVIEKRLDDSFCTRDMLVDENKRNLEECQRYGCEYILMEDDYSVDIKL